jgi:hypothetical protein
VSNYLFSKIKLGDIISMRYNNPAKPGFNMPRDILVISPNYLGFLHGITMNGLSAPEQEYLQQLLYAAYSNPTNVFAPLEAQIQARKKEIDILNKETNDLIRDGKRVVMTPISQESTFGMQSPQEKAKQLLGSVVGKISTFGRTQVQASAPNDKTQIDAKILQRNQVTAQKTNELHRLMMGLNQSKELMASIPRIPTEPYAFYHSFLKPFIGNSFRMRSIYRKFNNAQIRNPRILRSVGVFPSGQRR